MKKLLISLSATFLLIQSISAQGTDGILIDPNNATTRDASAVFQAQSTSQGMLTPRMTAAQRGAIPVSAARNGLLVYQTDAPAGFYYYDGTQWLLIGATSGAGLDGHVSYWNSATTQTYDADGNFYWDATNNRLGIGDATPSYTLDVNADIRAQNRMYVGTGGGYFYNDAGSRVRIDQDFYTNNNNTYLYGNNVYLGNSSGDAIHLRANFLDWTGGLGGIINTNGRVGIGTTAPTTLLHVSGATGSANVLIEADNDNVTETDQPSLTLTQDAGAVTGQLGYFGGTNELSLKNVYSDALNLATGDVTRLSISNAGAIRFHSAPYTTNGLLKTTGANGTLDIATPGTDYLTGNQTITLTGDVTGSGTTSIATTIANDAVTTAKILDNTITNTDILNGTIISADLANDAVTNAKLNNMAVNTLKGRITAGTGDPEDLNATQVKTILGLTNATTGTGTTNGVTYWSGASTLGSTAVGTAGTVLKGTGAAPAFGQVTTADILNGTITSADIANGTITTADIANGTVASIDITDNSVTSTDILNGTITGTDIAANTILGTHIGIGTTHGDLLYYNGTDWTRLAAGASGTFLRSNGVAAPTWVAAPSGSGTTNYLARWTSASTLGIGVTYDNGTNVGIGNTAPGAKLEVTGLTYLFNNLAEDLRVGRNTNEHLSVEVGDAHAYLDYEQDSDADGSHIFYIRNNALGAGENAIRFQTSATDRMTIADNGNVGIGSITPGYKLDVVGDIRAQSDFYGRAVDAQYSNAYRLGGVYFTWDSDSYGTNTHHSIRSTYGDSYGDNITLNSYNHIRFNMDANNNNPTSYFEVGDNTTATGNILFRLETGGDIALNGKHAIRSNDAWLRLNQTSAFTNGVYTPGLMRADGGYQVDGNQVIDADAGWHRSYGNTGWYNNTHAGGWYMTDATWIRNYNNKRRYQDTDAGDNTDGIMLDQQSATQDHALSSENDAWGLVGYSNRRWYVMYAWAGFGTSSLKYKTDVRELSNYEIDKSLADVNNIQSIYYKWNKAVWEKQNGKFADNMFHEDGEKPDPDYQVPSWLGFSVESLPEGIVDETGENYQYGAMIGLLVASTKALTKRTEILADALDIDLHKLKTEKSITKTISDFGSANTKGKETWINFSDDFTKQLNGKVPTITVTPSCTQQVIFSIAEKSAEGFKIISNTDIPVTFEYIAMGSINIDLGYSEEAQQKPILKTDIDAWYKEFSKKNKTNSPPPTSLAD